jgi:hypothetical protein
MAKPGFAARKALKAKLLPVVYEYGFLPKDEL